MTLPEQIKTDLEKKLTLVSDFVDGAKKALAEGDIETYYTSCSYGSAHLDQLHAHNVRILKTKRIYTQADANVEMDERREQEDLKRNIENQDRLGYEY